MNSRNENVKVLKWKQMEHKIDIRYVEGLVLLLLQKPFIFFQLKNKLPLLFWLVHVPSELWIQNATSIMYVLEGTVVD